MKKLSDALDAPGAFEGWLADERIKKLIRVDRAMAMAATLQWALDIGTEEEMDAEDFAHYLRSMLFRAEKFVKEEYT